jgi:hypothetical protein
VLLDPPCYLFFEIGSDVGEVILVEVMTEVGIDHKLAIDFDFMIVPWPDMPKDMRLGRDRLVEIIHAAGPVEHGGTEGRNFGSLDGPYKSGKVRPFDRGELAQRFFVVQELDK